MAKAPQTPQDGVVLSKFSGIRNTNSRERLSPEELERAVNVDLDDRGQLHRRRGYTQVLSANVSSLFTADNGMVYGVINGVLSLIDPNYTTYALQSGIGPAPLEYVQLGHDIYLTSETNSGRIDQRTNTVLPWGEEVSPGDWLSPVVNPTPTLSVVGGRLLGAPPLAAHMDYLNGRIYMASQKTLWATELYLYNYTDKTRNFLQFEETITMVGAVPDGLYIGTTAALWFLSGPFGKMKREMVIDHGVIPGSMVKVCADLVNPSVPLDQFSPDKNAIMFITTKGMCAGLVSGQVFNKSETDVLLPDAISAAALFRKQDGVHQYIGVLDSGGSPANAARIGDYVDAEIRRAGDWGYLCDGVRIGESIVADIV